MSELGDRCTVECRSINSRDPSCSWVELDPEVTPCLSYEWREGQEDLMHLPSILWLVVLWSLVRGTPEACAKGQVLEPHLEGRLDAHCTATSLVTSLVTSALLVTS